MKRSNNGADDAGARPKGGRTDRVFTVPSHRELKQREKTRFSQPQQVSGFSKFYDGRVQFDRSLLKRLRKSAALGSDLLVGLETFEEPPSTAPIEHIVDAMLRAHSQQHNTTNAATPAPIFNVVTYRNNLNKIMGVNTPYNTNSPYSFHVQRAHGCIYLNVHQLPPTYATNQYQSHAAYAGRRYETISTAESSGDGEYCGVFSVSLGQKKILVGAELDGLDEDGTYVELKTYRLLQTPKDRMSFERYKLLAFWIQSYVVGVPQIRVGFRDDDFRLTKEQTLSTTQLPRFGAAYWDSNVCLNFADMFLNWLLEQDIPEESVHVVDYNPRFKELSLRQTQDPCFLTSTLSTHLEFENRN
ncbi:Aste57867_4500 [Aphanomyces stellatus]|uniref:Decapping nuclease n=1 Tax=Aphanomyces stellatus TaxID=120398 RepID=A0A485KBU7_9STRA|nr:hypothetical protein As57867_004487 [Aphanomyces stellatus]VFT81610.1 Aste57867_4500 [Aphanomyces stellatus]